MRNRPLLPAFIMNVSAMAKELGGLERLVAAQVKAGLDKGEVMSSLCSSWSRRLEALVGLDASSQEALTLAVSKGPWTVDQRRQLAKAIMVEELDAGHKPKRRPNQTCLHFENFITEAEWRALRKQESTQASKLALLAVRAWLIGLELPSEPTLYRMTAVLAWCHGEYDFSQDDVRDKMKDLQTQIKARAARVRSVQLPYLVHFPHSASELAAPTLKYAYAGGVMPVDVDYPELDTILGNTKMRKGREEDWLKSVPDHVKPLLHAAMQRSRGSRQELSPSLQLGSADALRDQLTRASPRGSPSSRPGVLAIPDAEGEPALAEASSDALADGPQKLADEPQTLADVPTKLAEDTPGDAAGSLEEMEREMLAASRVRGKASGTSKKRPAASEAEHPRPAPMLKRPAAAAPRPSTSATRPETHAEAPSTSAASSPITDAVPSGAEPARQELTKPVLKRPSSANAGDSEIDMADVFEKMRADVGRLKRNAFKSRAYDSARRRMLAAGHDDSAAKVFAQGQAREATSLWESLHE